MACGRVVVIGGAVGWALAWIAAASMWAAVLVGALLLVR
jgi:hypothetical protein